jgi:Protein of unknown function (DUF3014)
LPRIKVGDLDDYELDDRRDPETGMVPGDPGPDRGFRMALLGGIVLLAAGITAVYLYVGRPAPKAAPTPAPPLGAPPLATPTAPPIALPPLDASDDLVRDLAKGFSAHPAFASWLQAKDLVRTFVAVVSNVVEKENPAPHVPFLAAKPPFLVRESKGRTIIDARSYTRLDSLADLVVSLDAPECARVFRLVEPLADTAYRELGHPGGGFSVALGKAIQALLEVPILEGDVPVRRVVRAVVVYEYEDPKVEALSPAQKALLRMGPRNVPRVQSKLRALADALERPAGRAAE